MTQLEISRCVWSLTQQNLWQLFQQQFEVRKGPTNREFAEQVVRQICEQWLNPQRSSTTLSEKPWFGRGIHFPESAISKSNPPPPVRLCERRSLCSANAYYPAHEQRLQQPALNARCWHEIKYPLRCDGQHMQHIRTFHMVQTELSHSSQRLGFNC